MNAFGRADRGGQMLRPGIEVLIAARIQAVDDLAAVLILVQNPDMEAWVLDTAHAAEVKSVRDQFVQVGLRIIQTDGGNDPYRHAPHFGADGRIECISTGS